MSARHALFPGTFDPPTVGHVDLVERAARTFDRLTVALAEHPTKQHLFSVDERTELWRRCLGPESKVEIVRLEGLVVDACRRLSCQAIVRGLRGPGDFEYESQMAGTNRVLAPEVETVFLAASPRFSHVTSTLVRQIASMGGDVGELVPPVVAEALAARFAR